MMQKNWNVIIVIVLILLAVTWSVADAREVAGTAKDKYTSLPLSGVKVWILETGDSTLTSASGFYYFPNIPEGTYTFMVGRTNYQPQIMTSVSVRPFLCGDANGNGIRNILDVTFTIAYLYKGGPSPNPLQAADVNHSGSINILDVTYMISYLYKGGPAPNCP